MAAVNKISTVDPAADAIREALKGFQLPEPQGWNLLIAVYQRPGKTAGGIILTDNQLAEDDYQGKHGLVLSIGPDAFQGPKFSGPRCKVGDWVLFGVRDGLRIKINGWPMRVLPDTSILATMATATSIDVAA